MNLYYKIVDFDEELRSIVVRYYTGLIEEDELKSDDSKRPDGTPLRCRTDIAINIPIPEPSVLGIHKLILRSAPIQALKDLELMKTGTEVELSTTNTQTLLNNLYSKSEEDITFLLSLSRPTGNGVSALTETEINQYIAPV